jgi:hypothetical protein
MCMKDSGRVSKKYPTIAVCGLDCGLCPRFYTNGPSRCPGCYGPGFADKHPSCSFITCCVKKRNLEVCGECPDFPCPKFKSEEEYDRVEGSSSYPSYKKLMPNQKYIKTHGIDEFIVMQAERIRLLEEMLAGFDDDRSRSFYCHAASSLGTALLKKSIERASKKVDRDGIGVDDKKTRAKILRDILAEAGE